MDEIIIKVSKADAAFILEALKYFSVHSSNFCRESAMEVYHIVQRQLQDQ